MESKVSRRKLNKEERRRKVWQMRLSGMSQYEIAHELGVCQQLISMDLHHVYESYSKTIEEEKHNFAKLDLQRMEAMLGACWPKALEGDLKAVHAVIRILERRSKLLGLDAAEKQSIQIHNTTEELSLESIRLKLLEALAAKNKV